MTVRRLIPVLGDQLSCSLPPLVEGDPAQDHMVMMEVGAEAKSAPHHPQKIALIFSAMRHFAEEARAKGWSLTYVTYAPKSSFEAELRQAIEALSPKEIHVTRASEWRVYEAQQRWQDRFGLPVHIHEDTRFFASLETFADWASDRKEWRMEYFYRLLRRHTGILMQGDQPVGDQWNFDKDNRKALPKDLAAPLRPRFEIDAITQEVLELVRQEFADNFGDLERFNWPVTRAQALVALNQFIAECLPLFGDFQDAMRLGAYREDDTLFHSLIAPALNLGLLEAREVCDAAEAAYHKGQAPLNAVEGFIRQILGWREYVRGLYWHMGPDYGQLNALEAHADLPASFWGAPTQMTCVREAVRSTRENAYAHHIQRLMVTGNFALLLGTEPAQVNEWYLSVYADAFEWVQLPNTHGMALFADGGRLASKPYAASGAYINRMSDYCKSCAYKVKQTLEDTACPLNALYWDFLARHEEAFSKNQRMGLALNNWRRKSSEDQAAIRAKAEALKANINTL